MGARDRGVWRFGCSETTTAPARSLQVVAERRSSPAGNSHAYHRTPPNMIETDGVPPIEDILQSMRRLNADVQIRDASFKKKESRPSMMESMREIQRGCELRAKEFASIDPFHHPLRSPSPREPALIALDPVNLRRASTYRSHHHCKENEVSLVSSTATMNQSLTRMEVGVESLGRLAQSAKNQVETILSQVRGLSGKFLESSSPKLHHHREHVLHHQEISEVSLLASSVLQQSEIKSREIINPVNRIDSLSLCSTAKNSVADEIPVLEIEEFKEVVAHQVFEETPQSLPTVDDEDEGAKSQETEATSKDFPEYTPKLNHPILEINEVNIQKVNESEIKFFEDDVKLEMNLCFMRKSQDYTLVFPVIETEGLSYVVEVDCKWDIDSVTLVAAYSFSEWYKER